MILYATDYYYLHSYIILHNLGVQILWTVELRLLRRLVLTRVNCIIDLEYILSHI